jgi:response regulator of citrate/malate metabolism
MIRTLVVDDDFMVADVHSGYLERLPGFQVVGRARTGEDALRLVAQLRPDLVLLDVYLPDLSGIEVLRGLRELEGRGGPPVDVIAVSAARDVETIRSAMRGGVSTYLVKPFSFAVFRDRLERYAAHRTQMERGGEADQEHVDRLYGILRGAGSTVRLPKGLSRATLELVVRALSAAGGDLSAQEVAAATGLSRVSARRYLEHLAECGRAELSLRYGAAGRPQHRYRWTRA